MKVLINENCINCGNCYMEVDKEKKVFKEGEGVAVIVEGADFVANKDLIQKAIDECPVGAIEMVEDEIAAGVPVSDVSEPEIPVEEVSAAPATEMPAMQGEVAQSPIAGDDLAVSSEPAPSPAPEAAPAPVDDEIPLG